MTTTRAHDEALAPLRRRIDELDKQIVHLLNERAAVVVEIGKIKRDGDAPIYAPDREQRVLAAIREANAGPLPDACLEAIWRELMSGSFALERKLRIGYLGPAGSFSHLAATRQFGACVDYHAFDEISSVFGGIARDQIDLGLVPIENTTGGGIHETLDCFLDATVRVCAEVLIAIHHNVLSKAEPADIRKLYSRPEVFAQCRRWLSTNLRGAERVAVASSARAAEIAGSEPGSAAVGSDLAGRLYDLPVRFANIEDNPNNTTRFFVIGKQTPGPTGEDKTAITFSTAHRAGALADVLDVFRAHGINLTHIDKRPSPTANFEYVFFVDCEGHTEEPRVADAIEAARQHCVALNVLGSFPRARGTV